MANDEIKCSDADLEPFIRNMFAIQIGNSTVDTSDSTDVGIVSFNMTLGVYYCTLCSYALLSFCVYYGTCRQLLNLRRKLGKWLIIKRVVSAVLPTMHMMLCGLWPWQSTGTVVLYNIIT